MKCSVSPPAPAPLTVDQLAAFLDEIPNPELVTESEYWCTFDSLTDSLHLGNSRGDAIANLTSACPAAGELGMDVAEHLEELDNNPWLNSYHDDEEDWDDDFYQKEDEEEDDEESGDESFLSDPELEMAGQVFLPFKGIREVYRPLVLPQRPVDLFKD